MARKSKSRSTIPGITTPGKTEAPRSPSREEPTAWESIKSHPREVAIVCIVLVVALALAAALGNGGRSKPKTTTKPLATDVKPTLVSAAQLKTFAASQHQVIYWLGPVKGDMYELTRTTANYVYVRYIPKGAKAGTKALHPFVATYPVKGALAQLESGANGHPLPVAGAAGAVAAEVPGLSTNVRLAFPDNPDYEIEVFDPHAGKARTIATSGAVRQVR